MPSGTDGVIAILEKREPLGGTTAAEKKAAFEKRILDSKQRIVVVEWLRDRQQASGLNLRKVEGSRKVHKGNRSCELEKFSSVFLRGHCDRRATTIDGNDRRDF